MCSKWVLLLSLRGVSVNDLKPCAINLLTPGFLWKMTLEVSLNAHKCSCSVGVFVIGTCRINLNENLKCVKSSKPWSLEDFTHLRCLIRLFKFVKSSKLWRLTIYQNVKMQNVKLVVVNCNPTGNPENNLKKRWFRSVKRLSWVYWTGINGGRSEFQVKETRKVLEKYNFKTLEH